MLEYQWLVITWPPVIITSMNSLGQGGWDYADYDHACVVGFAHQAKKRWILRAEDSRKENAASQREMFPEETSCA